MGLQDAKAVPVHKSLLVSLLHGWKNGLACLFCTIAAQEFKLLYYGGKVVYMTLKETMMFFFRFWPCWYEMPEHSNWNNDAASHAEDGPRQLAKRQTK